MQACIPAVWRPRTSINKIGGPDHIFCNDAIVCASYGPLNDVPEYAKVTYR
jgi:hypothetical protein